MTAAFRWTLSPYHLVGLTVGSHPAPSQHSRNEPDVLSLWICHDVSSINVSTEISIIIRPHCSTS